MTVSVPREARVRVLEQHLRWMDGGQIFWRNEEIELSSIEIVRGAPAHRPKLERDPRCLDLDVAKEIDDQHAHHVV